MQPQSSKAKSGQEQALVDFTLEALPGIRMVDELHQVEVSRSVSDSGRLLLYYWWESPAHSERYVSGPAYRQLAPRLEALAEEHVSVLAELIDA